MRFPQFVHTLRFVYESTCGKGINLVGSLGGILDPELPPLLQHEIHPPQL